MEKPGLRPLAPHDAELIEADAQRLWEEQENGDPRHAVWRPWVDLPEYQRVLYRDFARNPYRGGPRP